jgi:hypothetical protein
METFVVHFERSTKNGTRRGKRTVKARNALEATMKVNHTVTGSFGHWVVVWQR